MVSLWKLVICAETMLVELVQGLWESSADCQVIEDHVF